MRHYEFISEELSVPELKHEIVSQVQDLEDFGTLDKLHQILSSSDTRANIESALGNTTDNANIPNVDGVIDTMVKSIANMPGSTAEKIVFVEALEAGKAVNIEALMMPSTTFDQVFPLDFAKDFFVANGAFGRGINMKGPGEFALAIMSPEVKLAEKGDITIGSQDVEVKAAFNGSAGGRLGEVGPVSREVLSEQLNKTAAKYIETPEQEELFRPLGDVNSIALGKAAKYLHTVFPDNPEAIAACIGDVINLNFPGTTIGDEVGKAAAGDPTGMSTETEFMKQNFEWYKARDGFDSIMAIWFGGEKVYNFETGEEFAAMRLAGYLGSPSVSFIPTKQNEVYAQIKFTMKK